MFTAASKFQAVNGLRSSGDPFFSSVTLLMHMENVPSSGTFNDVTGKVITSNGVVSQSTVTKFSQSAQFVPASSAYLTTPNNAGFDFGTGNFTVEGWINQVSFATTGSPASNQNIFESRNQANGVEANRYILTVLPTGALQWTAAGPDVTTTSTVLMTTNTWNHFAVTRQGTDLRLFVNGQQGATRTDAQNYLCGTALAIGALRQANGATWNRGFFNGYMDDLRITKGIARYTTNFNVPTAPFADA